MPAISTGATQDLQAAVSWQRPRALDIEDLCKLGPPPEDKVDISRQKTEGKLLVDGYQVFTQGVFPLLQSVQKSIYISIYQFRAGLVGDDLVSLLTQKARQGIQVRILLDWEGSRQFLWNRSHELTQQLEQIPNIKILRSGAWDSITAKNKIHHKMIVVDGKEAVLGSTNLKNESLQHIHDIMVKIKGPAVQEIEQAFQRSWHSFAGDDDCFPERPVTNDDSSELLDASAQEIQVVQSMGTGDTTVIQTGRKLLENARRSILLEAAYLTDPSVQQQLLQHARRGISVSIIVPSISDYYDIPSTATANFLDKLVLAGGHIYKHPGRIHGKALLIDDSILYTGSADYLGVPMQDLNLLIRDPGIIADFRQNLFERDMSRSTEHTIQEANQRTRLEKARSNLWARFFRWIAS